MRETRSLNVCFFFLNFFFLFFILAFTLRERLMAQQQRTRDVWLNVFYFLSIGPTTHLLRLM